MPASRERFRGLIACLTTDYHDDGSLDEELIAENAGKLARSGAHGMYCLGATGEGYNVTDAEFERVVDVLTRVVPPDLVRIVGCYGPCLEQVLERGRYAQSAGADALLFVPPYYVPLNRRERLDSFERLAVACPNVGIIHYNTGAVPRLMLDAEDYAELAAIPNVWGSKQVISDFDEWLEFCRRSPSLVHMPLDSLFVPTLLFGGRGIFTELCNMSPRFAQDIWNACAREDWGTARSLQERWHRYSAELYTPLWREGYSYIALDKAFYNIAGYVRTTPPRPPLQAVPADRQRQLRLRMQQDFPELLHA
jgi:4-hydroxy-tetrahydrodipicolinate synthase